MNLRHLHFFVALAREGHHGRAAASCNVTQSTLSEAVRQLEHELGVRLVERKGQRFGGLSAEGLRALSWAKRILADKDALTQDLVELREGSSGTLRLGVIPAAMAVSPIITQAFCADHARVTVNILSRTSVDIEREIRNGELEAGITYLDNEPIRDVRTLRLYRERYVLLTSPRGPFAKHSSVTWREAAELRLCLLSRDMQNRRILERRFAESGAPHPRVAVETNSMVALIAHVRLGGWSSIVPHTFLSLLGHRGAALRGVKAIPLTAPATTQTIGLVVADREPLPSLARALLKSIRGLDISAELEKAMPTTT
ncbi:LysR substrate-binding domain-containing protein [Microbacteriaceae bacterium K1510]|nr:LysR substrate-binding domain-containing protein [Microbacteriaceae bacterium K1510]